MTHPSIRPSMHDRWLGRFGLILTLFFTAAFSHAQVDQGAISGTVADSSGRVVSGATVTITSDGTGLAFTRTTNTSGFYNFTPIKIGSYTLSVEAPNFAKFVQEKVQVNVSQTVGLNVTLKPGAVTETVTVTSSPVLQTQDAATGQTFTTQVINDTPLDNQNYVYIAQLTTGVAAPNQGFGQVAGAGDFTSNGNRVSQNNFLLDGVDNNSNMQDFLNGATYAVRPPPDALAEFKVESSDYSAELGRSTGAVVNASIKSGTNNFHGSLWEYLTNDRLDAADYFDTTGKSADHRNQFGATLGGPFWKNKLFFFGDAQGSRISAYQAPSPNNTVPTDLERVGNFTEQLNPNNTVGNGSIALFQVGGNPTNGIGGPETGQTRYLTCNGQQNVICSPNPVAEGILKLFPEPNQGAAHQVFNNYTIPATAATNNTTQYDVRVDFNPSASDQIFGRYSYDNNPRDQAPPLGILDGGGFGNTGSESNFGRSGVLSETHFFSPSLSNEFRVGFNWLYAAYLQVNAGTDIAAKYGLGGIPTGPSLGGFPGIGFGGYINGIGVPSYMPSNEKQNVLQILDNVSKVWGTHTVKFGVNFQHVRFYGLQPPDGIGSQSFNSTYTGDPGNPTVVTGSGVADFLLDDMNSSSLNTVTPTTNLRWYEAAFVQDDWKTSARLTLNLGLRWEYTQPLSALGNEQANFIGNYVNNNQGSGTYLIPSSEQSFPKAPIFLQTLAADHIGIQYTSNNYLVNPQHYNFAPRVGAAYSLSPKSVVRAGFGLFYGGFENIGLGLNLGNNAPFFVSDTFNPNPPVCYNNNGAVTCPTNGQTLETGFGAAATSPAALANAAGIGTIYANDQNDKVAVTAAYNASFQHMLTDTMSFTLGYQGNQSKHLRASYQANTYKGAVPVGANGQDLQPFHDFSIVNVANEGVGRFDSLQAKIDKRYSHGLYFLAGYTWGHCLDDAFGPIGQSEQGGYRNPTFLGFRYDYGDCTQNVFNRFTFSPQYDLPFGKGRRFMNRGGMLNEVAGGWKTSFVFQAQSGNPIFITSTNQGESYPFRLGDPMGAGTFGLNATTESEVQPQFNCAAKTRTLQQWFNPCAFKNPPRSAPQTSASQNYIAESVAGTIPFGPPDRQAVYGPGFNRLDMSLFKSFAIPFRESSLQLRADFFNLPNHPSFGNPGSGLSGSQSQAITSTRFEGVNNATPDQRTIQVAMRFTF